MGKKALVFQRADVSTVIPMIPSEVGDPISVVVNLDSLGRNVDLFNLSTTVEDRAECENNPSQLQLIPYVVLLDESTQKVFVYQRGKSGNEGRLHGKCSVGLGGHLEESVTETKRLIDVFVEGMARELEEEVGLVLSDDDKTLLTLETGKYTAIYTDEDEVGQVHFGLMVIVNAKPDQLKHTEKDVITRAQWLSVSEIISQLNSGEIEFEKWSELFLLSVSVAKNDITGLWEL